MAPVRIIAFETEGVDNDPISRFLSEMDITLLMDHTINPAPEPQDEIQRRDLSNGSIVSAIAAESEPGSGS